jgi:geranylgeranyl diphosphate/geranylgeranyl-bacteriochlorophyllide a reductase
MNTYDIAIIGAGPAGSTLARLLSGKYRVLLVDRRELLSPPQENSSIKMCGGLLAPDAQKMLACLGLGLPHSVLTGPQIFVVRAIDLKQKLERYYQRAYLNIDRELFDRWMVSLASSTVDVHAGVRFQSYEREQTGFRIQLVKNDRKYAVSARVLIGADGASSRVRRQAFPDNLMPARYISIQEWFVAQRDLPFFSAMFDPEITDFYSWIIPKGGVLILGAALLVDNHPAAKFSLLKHKLADYGFTFGERICTKGTFLLRPAKSSHICTGSGSIALVGEAAGWISPSSAEGISYALKSAISLAKALILDIDRFQALYWEHSRWMARDIMLKNVKSQFMYNPFLRKIIMRSGLMSVKLGKP